MSFLTAGLLTLIFYAEADPRFLFLFVLCLIVSEVFIQVRWRISIACPKCGFNPLLYVKNPELAANKVNEYFERKKQDPAFYLTQNPLIKVALQKAKSEKKNGKFKLVDKKKNELKTSEKSSGQHLSKTL